jgi:hypothetical protein
VRIPLCRSRAIFPKSLNFSNHLPIDELQKKNPPRAQGVETVAIQAIASILQTQNVSPPSEASQLASDLNQLSKDLNTSNWPAAEQDYVRFTEDAFNASETSPAPQPESVASTPPAGGSTINLVA